MGEPIMEKMQTVLSRSLGHRLAAIDIGTNSIRLIVAEALRGGNYRVLDEEKEPTRLGRTLGTTGRLDNKAVEHSLESLRRMKQIVDGFQVDQLQVIATCAVREAKNGKEFCLRAREEAGVDIRVISALREARLAFYSVQRSFDLTGRNLGLADIGGGSTEIVLASGSVIEAIYTTSLGAVRLSELFGSGQGLAGEDFERMVRHVDKHLKKRTKKSNFVPHILFGSGGTFTSLASMVMASRGQSDLPLRGYQISRADVRHLLDRLRKLSEKARCSVPGLNPDRADIIVAGLCIIDRIMRRFKINLLQVHNRGVRDGLLLSMIDDANITDKPVAQDEDASIDQFALKCGTDLRHGRQVARLAGIIFDQLVEPFSLDPDDRRLLEASARLQDVGYLIDYDRHHKHSYHLIINSHLPGFGIGELELIANVARYHRGADPKLKHSNFQQLSQADKQRVRQMAGVLRISGGLDRSHTQQVNNARVVVGEHEVEIFIEAKNVPEVDLWGARRRTGLFEKAFGKPVVIDWVDVRPADESSETIKKIKAGKGSTES